MPQPIPTTVLTGFLGSGKTTLLKRGLASPALADTAVVINELGEIVIDHHLVDFVEGTVLELAGGCLCCAVREDLARTLRALVERADHGELRPFRRIVVETTGLADPAPILHTLGADPALEARLSLARVVTIVDATTGAATLDRFAEARRQAAVADAIVVSKTDLAPASADLERRLAALNPGAGRLRAAEADAGQILFGGSPHPGPPPPPPNPPPLAGEGWVGAAGEGGTRAAGEWGSTPHPEHTHGIDSFVVTFGRAMTRLDFARVLGGLAAAHGNDLLRVKGILAFADRPERPAVIQAAQHALFAPEWLEAWPDGDRRSRLVFITHDIARDEILARFAFAEPCVLSR